jgi:CO/xanthine dehydrogenase Mo-binding subunit
VYPTRSIVSEILGVPLERVRVIFTRGAGCYGLNGGDAVSFDAAVMSQAVGRPVRVQLSREDEMAWENFGNAVVVRQRAGLDRDGSIIAWECEAWEASRGGRPGYDKPGNVITGLLLGYQPEPITPRGAAEPTGELRNRSNAAPSYVAGCINRNCGGAGTVRSERVLVHTVASPFFTGPLRSPSRVQNTFAHECFMDELCARVKADPVAFRLQHLREQRVVNVVKAAAELARWEKRPSAKANVSPTGSSSGRGIACVAYEGDNGYVALVAEVDVDQASGRVMPRRFFAAVDAGPVSNPDGLRNQIEGGILQATSRALVERVTWDDKRVTSVDWQSYPTLDMGMEVPTVEVTLLNPTGVPATGAGEMVVTVVPAAIGNAIFDAAGARVREVPFTPERVKAALASSLTGLN